MVVNEETREIYSDTEIAVDLPHVDVVLNYLREIDPDENRPSAVAGETEPLLDLGLVVLTDPARTAGKFTDIDPSMSALDIVLEGMRRGLGEKYSGWIPRMGKVRGIETIGGLPHIGTGGNGYPNATASVNIMAKGDPFEGQRVRVGIIDTRIFNNSLLGDRWFAPQSSILPAAGPYDWLDGHCVAVAGAVLARAPRAQLEIAGLLSGAGATATVWDVAKTMVAFLGRDVSVLNLSLGGFAKDGRATFVLDRAVEVLRQRGVVVVVAAGNHGASTGCSGLAPNAPSYPAACPGAVAVGAVDPGNEFRPASFSPQAPWVNLVAPGVDVPSTYLSGEVLFHQLPGMAAPPSSPQVFSGFATWSGTSFAAGTISGEIARRTVPGFRTAQQAVAELLELDPKANHGIGRYEQNP